MEQVVTVYQPFFLGSFQVFFTHVHYGFGRDMVTDKRAHVTFNN